LISLTFGESTFTITGFSIKKDKLDDQRNVFVKLNT